MSDKDPSDAADRLAADTAARSDSVEERLGRRLQVDEEFSAFYRSTIRPLVGFLINQGAELPVAADIADRCGCVS